MDAGRRAALALAAAPWVAAAQGADAAPNAAVLRRVEALRPNQALRLGRARVLGELNATARQFGLDRTGPRARDFCRKMVWAPERRRALFTGANHGSPHRLNDVWEFDLAALAWVLLYAPDLPRSGTGLGADASDVVFRNGVLMTRRGGPAIIGHTWSGLTYDAARRRMLFMNVWVAAHAPLVQQLGGDPSALYLGPPLWSFDPAARSWEIVKSPQPWPRTAGAGMLEWVPELNGSVWHFNGWQLSASWLLGGDDAWSVIADEHRSPGFARNAPGEELVGYHDPVRKRIVALCRHDSFHFDTAARRWSRALGSNSVFGHDAQSVFYRYGAGGMGLFVDLKEGRLHAYDADAPTWGRLQPDGDPMPYGPHVLAYMDLTLNVLVAIDDTEVWVYRPPV